MERLDIQYSLRKAGYRQVDIARKLKLSKTTVGDIIAGRQRSQRIAREISSILRRPVAEIWPGQYPDLEREQSHRRAA